MKIKMYAHYGSHNHGCEAIVRSTKDIISDEKFVYELYSNNVKEDIKYGINDKDITLINSHYDRNSLMGIVIRILNRVLPDLSLNIRYRNIDKKENYIALSIGGDNYCYQGWIKELKFFNKKISSSKNGISVLWGCSIEPELLKDEDILENIKLYSLITPRETITYNALIDAGVKNVKLFPDPAFVLKNVMLPLPNKFTENNTIGINISPLILDYEKDKDSTLKNYINLVNYIVINTDMNIALIPHVVDNQANNDDRETLKILYNSIENKDRVVVIDDCNCMELKGFISRCRMFIGARTHATIAAYSTCVPTLVVGYSVKSKGIAKDIFGTYKNYVLPVQELENENNLVNAFKWLYKNEDNIRKHLKEFMPSYIDKVWMAKDEIKRLENKKNTK